MEVQFNKDNFRFNVRSSAILKDKEHKYVILSNMRAIKSHDAYLLPGGRLDIMGSSHEAVIREIEEELEIKVNCRLISIEENYNKNENFHMIEFVYYGEVDNLTPGSFTSKDKWDKFKVVEIDKIDDFDIRPTHVKELIKMNDYDNIYHSINYNWGDEKV